MTESSSAFISPTDFSSEWRDISLTLRHSHSLVYIATRYGRRFLLKTLPPENAALTDFRLQQEREFQLAVQLVHPNIAATYSLEQVDGIGRCIVQEWIDGRIFSEWLQTNPSHAARERVFQQLLDVLEYLHSLQLVHHDLKADNILITRNGINVKLIDFGLSATDSTISPVPNDPIADIRSLGRLLPELFPQRRTMARRCLNGNYANVSALRRAINNRHRLFRLLPLILSVLLLVLSVALFFLAWQTRHAEQQRHEDMVALVDTHIAAEREQLLELVNRPDSFDKNNAADMIAYGNYINEYTTIRHQQWLIRDSLMAVFPDSDPLREQFFQLWSHRELDLDNELYPQITGKLKR